MDKFKIEIQTFSKEILQDLFDEDVQELSEGNKKQIENTDSELEIIDYSPTESFGMVEVVTLMLTMGSGVAVNMTSEWLMDKLKKKKDVIAITVNGKSISAKNFTEERLISVMKAMSQGSE